MKIFKKDGYIDILLEQGENAYDVIGGFVAAYWEDYPQEDAIVCVGVSDDGEYYTVMKEVVLPYGMSDSEFLRDWWEGQKYLKLFGIMNVSEVDVSGGIYITDYECVV